MPPVELDDRTNPRYAEQWEEMVQCLRKNGLKVTATKPGEWRYDSLNADDGATARRQVRHRRRLPWEDLQARHRADQKQVRRGPGGPGWC
ncbi:hypothetical protein [Micromonospora matsumotoense]|uniref:hypothetical protein n=1 Tax=Micromonospora matsumotoense TaxID=121616 RepID=UPI0033FD2491